MTGRADTLRDLVIATCAVSAGIHGALVPAHLAEGAAAGSAFAASAALLAGLAVALTRYAAPALVAGAAASFAALLVTYALAVTVGVPVLHPEAEPIEALAVFTKAVELTGLAIAIHLLRLRGASHEHEELASDPARTNRADRLLQRPGGTGRLERTHGARP